MPRFGQPMHVGTADISHFRAPYKNWMLAGLGAEPSGPFTVEPSGVRVLTPERKKQFLEALPAWSVIFISNNDVKLDPRVPGDIRESAAAWVAKKLAEGKTVVVAATPTLETYFLPIQAERALKAVSGKAGELDAAGPTTLAFSAVAARPADKPAILGKPATAGVFGGVLLAGLIVGTAIVGIAALSKKRARPNRRRRHGRGRR